MRYVTVTVETVRVGRLVMLMVVYCVYYILLYNDFIL